MFQFSSRLSRLDSDVYQLHLPLPDEVAQRAKATHHSRFKVTFNGLITKYTGLMPEGSYYFLLVNQQEADLLQVAVGQEVQVTMEPDESKYGMPIPEELEELLQQDTAAAQWFEKLTPGKQRNLIYIVSQSKRSETRIRKALAIAHHLKEVNGKLDFKKLNETLKEFR